MFWGAIFDQVVKILLYLLIVFIDTVSLISKFDYMFFQCIKTLLDNGCSPDITDNNGLTAAELAKKCFHNSCADLIQSYISQVKKKLFS